MPSTFRQDLVDAVIAAIENIQIANGYQTDLGLRPIEDWPRRFDQEELPVVGIHDLTETEEKESHSSIAEKRLLPLVVRISTASSTPAATLRQYIGDVQTALGKDPTWGGKAIDTKPKQNGFIIPEQAFEVAGAAVEVEIEYCTRPFDSFGE